MRGVIHYYFNAGGASGYTHMYRSTSMSNLTVALNSNTVAGPVRSVAGGTSLVVLINSGPRRTRPMINVRVHRTVGENYGLVMISPHSVNLTGGTSVRLGLGPNAGITFTGNVVGIVLSRNLRSSGFVTRHARNFRRLGRVMGSCAPRGMTRVYRVSTSSLEGTTVVCTGTSHTPVVCYLNMARRSANARNIVSVSGVTVVINGLKHRNYNIGPLHKRGGMRNTYSVNTRPGMCPKCRGIASPTIHRGFRGT